MNGERNTENPTSAGCLVLEGDAERYDAGSS